jgi:lysophospholipase L1-like esterase
MAGTPLRTRLSFSLVTTLVVLGGAELGLRGAGWPSLNGAFTHNEPYWVVDPNLKDAARDHREEGRTFAISTDDNGLRPPHHPVDKPAGAFRLMALGCSTTFGWGVADAETYPARLESLAREGGQAKVEVINGGQPGYTSFQGLWLWDQVLHRYDPDVVMIGYIVQDARTAAYTDRSQAILQGDGRYLKDHVLYRSRIYLGLRSLLGEVQVRAKERPDGSAEGVNRVPPADYVDNLRTLVAKVQASGATPVLFGYPLERAGYTQGHRAILQAAAQELGVPHIDPQVEMEAASQAQSLYFTQDRGHANAAGNDWIARKVYASLQSQHLLGP